MVTLYDRPPPGADGEKPQPAGWEAIFEAPDIAKLLGPKASPKANEYEKKVNALLKAGLTGCINTQNFPDAAAILAHGPAFAKTTGVLAATDERFAKGIDIITSPSNPYAMWAITAVTLAGQLWRNHEKELEQVPASWRDRNARRKAMRAAGAPKPEPQFVIKILGKSIPIRIKTKFRPFKLFTGSLKYQTTDPMQLTAQIFGDPDVIKALDKMGFKVVPQRETP